jgi:hypothetical protein
LGHKNHNKYEIYKCINSRVWCGVEGYRKLGSEKTRVLEGKETYKEEGRKKKWKRRLEKGRMKEGNEKYGYRFWIKINKYIYIN